MEQYAVFGHDGKEINPGEGIVPVILETEPGKLKIIGTGFFIARNGLFVSAQHVLSELADLTKSKIHSSYVAQPRGNSEYFLRRIINITYNGHFDIGIGIADNAFVSVPENPMINRTATLSLDIPLAGSKVVTYAYPENKYWDLQTPGTIPVIRSDFYQGNFIRYVDPSENPSIPYPHYETTIKLKSGSSGGPVFDNEGRVIGVNCRGWDFSPDQENLSYIVPIKYLLDLEAPWRQLPAKSWELQQIPMDRRNMPLQVQELARYEIIRFIPPI